jgi:glycosyltransferase involved in cell wall biosynthesis
MNPVDSILSGVFWSSAALILYGYLLYPLLLCILPAQRRASAGPQPPVTRVTIIIAAYNEAQKIESKLLNTLALEANGLELEIMVASDASTDATDEIVLSFATRGVMLVRAPQRLGKEYAQKLAIARATGDVILFTDVATVLAVDALRRLSTCFSDPQVGAVSSVDKVVSDDGQIEGEGLYVRYEMWLRDLETRFNTLVGLSGSFFAARRIVCQRWDIEVCSDFGVALNCAQLGFKAVSDRVVVGYYRNLADPNREYTRKVRTVLRGMRGLVFRFDVLNPLRYGAFSFQVLSHKVMRWAVPWLLVICEISAILLARDGSWLHVMLVESLTLLCMSPLIVRWFPFLRRYSFIRLAAFFIEVNAAILHATLKLLAGHDIKAWEPSKR